VTELERLRDLLDAGNVKLGVHIRKMNSPGSPVFRQWENVWPPGVILAASLLATKFVHFYLGGAVLAVGCWWWLGKVMPRIKDGVYDRTAAMVLINETSFDLWWAKGVLSLYLKMPDGTESAATSRNDWRAWVRAVPDSALAAATETTPRVHVED
jgi:hypothetical protein